MITRTINNIKYTFTENGVGAMLSHLVSDSTPEQGKCTLLEFSETAFDMKTRQYLKHREQLVWVVNQKIREAIELIETETTLKVTGE